MCVLSFCQKHVVFIKHDESEMIRKNKIWIVFAKIVKNGAFLNPLSAYFLGNSRLSSNFLDLSEPILESQGMGAIFYKKSKKLLEKGKILEN